MSEQIVNFEAETQQLGTSPVIFVDAVINAANDYSYDSSELMLKQLLTADPKLDPIQLRKSIQQLLTFVQDQLDKYFDKFELYCLTNVLKIPKHVKLDSDMPPTDTPAPTYRELENVDNEQYELLEKIRTAKRKHSELLRERRRLNREHQRLHQQQQWIATLKKTCKKVGLSRPKEDINLVLGDFELLSNLATRLRTRKHQLVASDTSESNRKRIRFDKNVKGVF